MSKIINPNAATKVAEAYVEPNERVLDPEKLDALDT